MDYGKFKHTDMNEKIAIAGTGYVGLSMAILLSQHNHVTAVDVIPEKVDMINSGKSPIQDEYIEKYLSEKDLDLKATLDGAEAYRTADWVIIAAPTNYDPAKNFFDTSHVEEVIDLVLSVNPDAVMVSLYSNTLADAMALVKDKFILSKVQNSRQELRLKLNPEPVIKKTDDKTAKDQK